MSCVTWQVAPGPVSGSLARHESGSESVSVPAMACSGLERCGKQGSGSKVSVEQVQATFGKFPRTNTLSVREVQLSFYFFLAIFGRVQHARPPCPLPTPRVYSNSCPLSQ